MSLNVMKIDDQEQQIVELESQLNTAEISKKNIVVSSSARLREKCRRGHGRYTVTCNVTLSTWPPLDVTGGHCRAAG